MALNPIQRLELRREERSNDNRLHFGQAILEWSIQPKSTFVSSVFGLEMDVDLGAFLLDKDGNVIDLVHYQKKQSNCGAVVFDQDSHDKQKIEEKLVENKIASENIEFDLGVVNKNADYVVFVAILNNNNVEFDKLKDAKFTLLNTANKKVLISEKLTPNMDVSGCVLAVLKYHPTIRNWSSHWIEEYVIAGAFTQMQLIVQRAALFC